MSASLFLDQSVARALRGGGNGEPFPVPRVLFGQLHDGNPGDYGADHVLSGQRQEVRFDTDGRRNELVNTPEWVNLPVRATVRWVSVWDEAGNCYGSGELIEPKPVSPGDSFRLDTFQVDFR